MKKKLLTALLGIILISSIGTTQVSVFSGGEDLPPVHKMNVTEPSTFL